MHHHVPNLDAHYPHPGHANFFVLTIRVFMYPFFSQNFRPMKLFSEASEIFVGKRARKNQLTLTTKFLTYENMLVDEVGYYLGGLCSNTESNNTYPLRPSV